MAEVPLSYREELADGWSDAKRSAVIEEVNLVVNHPLFKNSNHCVALLRYVVDHAITRSGTSIKERTLGVEVFGRSANYDVSNDPVVRRIASEIRKKLAQYYQERGTVGPVRIHLVRGSYVPEFEFLSEDTASGVVTKRFEEAVIVPETDSRVLELPAQTAAAIGPRRRGRKWLLGTVAAGAMAAAIFAAVQWIAVRTPDYRIWKPLLNSSDAITVCLPLHNLAATDAHKPEADGSNTSASPALNTIGTFDDSDPSTLFRDVHAGNSVTALLSKFKKKIDLKPWPALKFSDLQQEPVVLIGGLNNAWVPFLLSNLRYTVHYDTTTELAWIEDAQNPSNRDWQIEHKYLNQPEFTDYAVITRTFDQQTGQWIMALSGLEARGTEAAAELISDPSFSKLIPANVPDKGNFQIVIRATILNGEPGPIQILAVRTW